MIDITFRPENGFLPRWAVDAGLAILKKHGVTIRNVTETTDFGSTDSQDATELINSLQAPGRRPSIPYDAPQVERCARRYVDGSSLSEIASLLREAKEPGSWSPQRVSAMFRNDRYRRHLAAELLAAVDERLKRTGRPRG